MSSIVNIKYLDDRGELEVTWPNGTVHRYGLNVSPHDLANMIADSLSSFYASGKMDTLNHWINVPHDAKWVDKEGDVQPVIDSSMSVERVAALCEKYDVRVTCNPKSSDTFRKWYLTGKDVALAGDDLVELFAEVEAKANKPLFTGPVGYSTNAVQDRCKKYGLCVTCTGNIWQIRKDGVLLQADYKLERAFERITKGQVS